MRITYFALRPIQVGAAIRQPGDLVPEADAWPYLSGYVQDGKLAPVLVATLPAKAQEMLSQWEQTQGRVHAAEAPEEETEDFDESGDSSKGSPEAADDQTADDSTAEGLESEADQTGGGDDKAGAGAEGEAASSPRRSPKVAVKRKVA